MDRPVVTEAKIQGRALAWLALFVALVYSVAANVAYAKPHVGPRLAAAAAPVLVILAAGLLERVSMAGLRWWRRAPALLGLAVVTGAAFVTSFEHQFSLLVRYGDTRLSAALLPMGVDGLIVLASVCLAIIAERRRAAPPFAPHALEPSAAQPALIFATGMEPADEQQGASASPMLAPRPPAPPRRYPPEWIAEVRERYAAGEELAVIHEDMFGPPPEPFSGEVDLLGERPGSEALELPCVYWVRNAQGVVIYIGHTVDLAKRIGEHRRSAEWAADAARLEFQTYRTVDEAAREERAAIRAQQPQHNTVKYPGRGAQKIRADVPKAAQREQAWRMCAEGKTVAEIRAQFNGDGPSKRTVEYWTQELRDLPMEARAGKLAELLALVGTSATSAPTPPDPGSST